MQGKGTNPKLYVCLLKLINFIRFKNRPIVTCIVLPCNWVPNNIFKSILNGRNQKVKFKFFNQNVYNFKHKFQIVY